MISYINILSNPKPNRYDRNKNITYCMKTTSKDIRKIRVILIPINLTTRTKEIFKTIQFTQIGRVM